MDIAISNYQRCSFMLHGIINKGESQIEIELRREIGIWVLEERVFKVSLADLKTDEYEMEKLMRLASSKKTRSRSISSILIAKKDDLKKKFIYDYGFLLEISLVRDELFKSGPRIFKKVGASSLLVLLGNEILSWVDWSLF